MRNALVLAPAAVVFLMTSGCLATQQEQADLTAKNAQLEKDVAQTRADLVAMRADLDATRQRLDNALRANADSSSDLLTSKQRLNELAGRVDEANHGMEELRRDANASRTELYARLDELKRTQPAAASPAVAPIAVPSDKSAHYRQLEDAYGKKDWATVRALGPDFAIRYPADDKADEAIFFVGSADLIDGRPSSALGQFNRLLKLYPHSNVLDKTLYSMGDAYVMLHDCSNAKLAYDACEKRFSKEKMGADARKQLETIAKNPPGLCAPQ